MTVNIISRRYRFRIFLVLRSTRTLVRSLYVETQRESTFLLQPPSVVDVAIKNVSDKVYSGDARKRQSVEMKFGDYITYYTAKYTNNNHWLCSVSDLEFYLCQCPMFVDEETIEKGVSMKTSLPKLMQHFQMYTVAFSHFRRFNRVIYRVDQIC